jgi:hypothetical protein
VPSDGKHDSEVHEGGFVNQDKIKQAFEAWWETERGGKPLNNDYIPVTETQLYAWENQTWLAACEWLMSQGGGTEFEQYEAWSRLYFGHGMPPSQSYFEATMSSFNFAHLSCAKELSEKDKKIEELKKKNATLRGAIALHEVDNEKDGARIAALEGELAKMYYITKLAHSYDEQFPLAAELASKKEG